MGRCNGIGVGAMRGVGDGVAVGETVPQAGNNVSTSILKIRQSQRR